jgi:hypothetical protein
MDNRKIKAILFANGIVDLTSIKILGLKDKYLEVTKNGKLRKLRIPGTEYIELEDAKIDEPIGENFETKTQDEKIEAIIEDIKKSPIALKVETYVEDDEIFNDVKVDKNIDDFKVDLDDNFNLEDELKEIETPKIVEKPKVIKPKTVKKVVVKPKKKSAKKKVIKNTPVKKPKDGDDNGFINLA